MSSSSQTAQERTKEWIKQTYRDELGREAGQEGFGREEKSRWQCFFLCPSGRRFECVPRF